MIEKFKNLTKNKKILVSIIAIIFLPIILLVLSFNLLIKSIKDKKIVKSIGGVVLVSLTLNLTLLWFSIPFAISSSDTTYEVDSEPTNIDTTKEEESKKLNISIKESSEIKDGKIRFDITTNIPDSAELIIGLFGLDNNEYKGQTKATVENGKVQTEWFSNKGNPLTNGEYELSISMSIPKLQPQAVQDVVGVNGEFMEGDYVEKSDTFDSYSISKVTTINITDGASAEKKASINEEHRLVVDTLYNELKNEYTNQLSNYNESSFYSFIADWNRRRNDAHSKMSNEDPLMKYSMAMSYLPHLETQLRYKLSGKDYDKSYIKETMSFIEEAIE